MNAFVRYGIRRATGLLLLLLLLLTASFFIMRFSPGGPFDAERNLEGSVMENLKAKYRLDQPLLQQYLDYLCNLLVLDLGVSMKYRTWTVADLLLQSFPQSALLGSLSLVYSLLFGLGTGYVSALRRHFHVGDLLMGAAVLGISIPNFLLGSLLVILFSLMIPLFPVAGWGGFSHWVLPSVTLGTPFAAIIARLFKRTLVEVMSQDFIRTAEAKGLAEKRVILRHAFRLSIIPVLSFLGPAAAGILTGSVVVEKVFAIPGMGTHFVNGAFNRDYPLVLGAVLVYGFLLISFNMIVDLLYFLLDPRVRTKL